MAFPTKIDKDKLLHDPMLTQALVSQVMNAYYRPEQQVPDRTPVEGVCLPVHPEVRLTGSPTGGVIGRYMEIAQSDGPNYASSYSDAAVTKGPLTTGMSDGHKLVAVPLIFVNGRSAAEDNQWPPLQPPLPLQGISARKPMVVNGHAKIPARQQVNGGQEQQHKVPYQNYLNTHTGHMPTAPRTMLSNAALSQSLNTTQFPGKTPVVTPLSPSNKIPPRTQLKPEDIKFLFSKLDEHLANSQPQPTELLPVHSGRPGQHILRAHPTTGQLYVCIPRNPYVPLQPKLFTTTDSTRTQQTQQSQQQQGYTLPTYDSFLTSRRPGSSFLTTHPRPTARCPYPPASPSSSLLHCAHCASPPTRVLHNDILCPYHGYYLASGKLLGYYEFCCLVELESSYGCSINNCFWTLDEMAVLVDVLTVSIMKWLLVAESTPIPPGTWTAKVSPYGPVGSGPVPAAATGRSAVWFGLREEEEAEAESYATAGVAYLRGLRGICHQLAPPPGLTAPPAAGNGSRAGGGRGREDPGSLLMWPSRGQAWTDEELQLLQMHGLYSPFSFPKRRQG